MLLRLGVILVDWRHLLMISSLHGSGLVVTFSSEERYLHEQSLASFPDFLQAAFSCALSVLGSTFP